MSSNAARGHFIAAWQQKRGMTVGKTTDRGKVRWTQGKTWRLSLARSSEAPRA